MTSILSQQRWVFNAINSNEIIFKTEGIVSIFFCISGIYIKDFENKDEPQGWCIYEIIDCKKRGYLNT